MKIVKLLNIFINIFLLFLGTLKPGRFDASLAGVPTAVEIVLSCNGEDGGTAIWALNSVPG